LLHKIAAELHPDFGPCAISKTSAQSFPLDFIEGQLVAAPESVSEIFSLPRCPNAPETVRGGYGFANLAQRQGMSERKSRVCKS
jgi:hypothetical protein